MPFDYRNKAAFAFKFYTYLGVGFGLPFFAAWYQLYVKSPCNRSAFHVAPIVARRRKIRRVYVLAARQEIQTRFVEHSNSTQSFSGSFLTAVFERLKPRA